MKLYQVKKGKHLKWHTTTGWGHKDAHRGSEGYIVDLDAPLESMFCGTQMRKLEPIKDGAPSPITNPLALRMIADAKAKIEAAKAPTPAPVPAPAAKAPAAAPVQASLPTVDRPSKASAS